VGKNWDTLRTDLLSRLSTVAIYYTYNVSIYNTRYCETVACKSPLHYESLRSVISKLRGDDVNIREDALQWNLRVITCWHACVFKWSVATQQYKVQTNGRRGNDLADTRIIPDIPRIFCTHHLSNDWRTFLIYSCPLYVEQYTGLQDYTINRRPLTGHFKWRSTTKMLMSDIDLFAAVLERIHHVFLDDHATTNRNLPANDELVRATRDVCKRRCTLTDKNCSD